MKEKIKNYKPYKVAFDKVLFGRLYHVTMSFSPPPPDVAEARQQAEVLAERMVQEARLRELFGEGSLSFPSPHQAL